MQGVGLLCKTRSAKETALWYFAAHRGLLLQMLFYVLLEPKFLKNSLHCTKSVNAKPAAVFKIIDRLWRLLMKNLLFVCVVFF